MELKVNVKYGVGDKCFTVKETNYRESCDCCNGNKQVYISSELGALGAYIECPKCNGKGYITDSSKKMYIVIEQEVIVSKIKINVSGDNKYTYKYQIKVDNRNYNRSDDKLFSTIEDAQAWCDKMNRPKRKLNLTDIIIPESFKHSKQNTEKIKYKLDYYNKHNKFESKIVVNKNNVLIDGYITYLLARMYNKEIIECYVENSDK